MFSESSIIPTSPYDDFCDGYGNPGAEGSGYILGFVMEIGKVRLSDIDVGSRNLDEIYAFDKAEAQGAVIGQINMITVSSFCGPMGYIWGYDLAKHDKLRQPSQMGLSKVTFKNWSAKLYSLRPLLDATRDLFGTVSNKKFPIIPGAHVPCAVKDITHMGPKYLYCGLAVGIPQDRNKNACLLMEDIGWTENDSLQTQEQILEKMAKSILKVGENQQVIYDEIFLDIKFSFISENEMGCALVACPYFSLARKAIPRQEAQTLKTMTLSEWSNSLK